MHFSASPFYLDKSEFPIYSTQFSSINSPSLKFILNSSMLSGYSEIPNNHSI